MNKLIFRKLSIDILKFFLFASFCVTFIVWIIQAVNLLDLVSEDGHSLKVYTYYMALSLPKIFSRTVIFVFFISIFYIISKYKNSNELIVFWTNGIKKIHFINFIFKFSIMFLLLQLILNLFIVPKAQNLGRIYIKNSNIDFLPKLISEKKFISVVKDLTIFVEAYKKDGLLEKIYIKEKIDNNKSKIIVAANGRFIKKKKNYILRLYNGGITNIDKNKIYKIKFSETDFNFSKFSTKTITDQKVQEIDSLILFNCLKNYYFKKEFNNNKACANRKTKSLVGEMYKRSVIPFYTIIVSLIAASLILEPKSNNFIRFHALNIFFMGVIIITLSQISLKFIDPSNFLTNTILFLPIVLILIYYLLLILKTKFKLSLL